MPVLGFARWSASAPLDNDYRGPMRLALTLSALMLVTCSPQPSLPSRLSLAPGAWLALETKPVGALEFVVGDRRVAVPSFEWRAQPIFVVPVLLDSSGDPITGHATLLEGERVLREFELTTPVRSSGRHLEALLDQAQSVAEDPSLRYLNRDAEVRAERARATLRRMIPQVRRLLSEGRSSPDASVSGAALARELELVDGLLESARLGIHGAGGVSRQALSIDAALAFGVATTTALFGLEAAVIGAATVLVVLVVVEVIIVARNVVAAASEALGALRERTTEVLESADRLRRGGLGMVEDTLRSLHESLARTPVDDDIVEVQQTVRNERAGSSGAACGPIVCIREYTTCCPWLGYDACHPPGYRCPESNVPVRVVSGADQQGVQGVDLPQPIVVEVRDARGIPLKNIPVFALHAEDVWEQGVPRMAPGSVDSYGPHYGLPKCAPGARPPSPCVDVDWPQRTDVMGRVSFRLRPEFGVCAETFVSTLGAGTPTCTWFDPADTVSIESWLPRDDDGGTVVVQRTPLRAIVPRPMVSATLGSSQSAPAGAAYLNPIGVQVFEPNGLAARVRVTFSQVAALLRNDGTVDGHGSFLRCTTCASNEVEGSAGASITTSVRVAATGTGTTADPYRCAQFTWPNATLAVMWSLAIVKPDDSAESVQSGYIPVRCE